MIKYLIIGFVIGSIIWVINFLIKNKIKNNENRQNKGKFKYFLITLILFACFMLFVFPRLNISIANLVQKILPILSLIRNFYQFKL